jgi:hypothetical protein
MAGSGWYPGVPSWRRTTPKSARTEVFIMVGL